jgi:hypothetical protein
MPPQPAPVAARTPVRLRPGVISAKIKKILENNRKINYHNITP